MLYRKENGEVYRLDDLISKYPHTRHGRGWQYVFPSIALSVNHRSGTVKDLLSFHLDLFTLVLEPFPYYLGI